MKLFRLLAELAHNLHFGEDFGLKAFGLGAATSSAIFAVTMIGGGANEPKIVAMEHFAIFAKPAAVRAARPAVADDIDPIVTGGVGAPPQRPPNGPPPTGPRLGGFRIIGVVDNQAILLSDAGFRRIKVGDKLSESLTVARIEKREQGFMVILSDGSFIGAQGPEKEHAAEPGSVAR